MKVAVTGSHGLIGSALLTALEDAGHEVVRVVRGSPAPGEVHWDPQADVLDGTLLAGIGAAINLAGEGLAEKRWSSDQKQLILASRVQSTGLLARRLAELDPKPKVLISGSAVGVYGDRGAEAVDEQSAIGSGFLAEVCRRWEDATSTAAAAGIRVVHIRTGIVLSHRGGALKQQLPFFKFGVGGKLGSGRQYLSWISVDDEVGAILHALSNEALSGPVNLTAPQPVTNAEFTRTLGAVLRRPTLLPVPRFGLSVLFGSEMADEMLLAGQRVLPRKLEQNGYAFRHPTLDAALRSMLSG